ncbi:DTW domain-containing protein [Phascolomyces articulosus]|uniref:tRNA-uridine aminocarboxypropyltransferase 1 n=1 Tax=Phascolomyces articulosus TaxID=60185 RepID=A0AAD5K2F7_9FUNG|nr:DTW domain-containing protein [Phascolomyces articulosus]
MSDTEKKNEQTSVTNESPSIESQSSKRSLSEEKDTRNEQQSEENEPKRSKLESPFDDLKISDDSILDTIKERTTCPTCKKSVKYFCYRCFTVVGMDRSEIPSLKLPVPLNIIKHEQELDGKSTALHSAVIAHDDVKVYSWQEIPEFEKPERTLLLFPGDDAKRLEDIPRESFDRITVIDGTWKQAGKIVRETPVLQRMQKVTIAPRKTHFWRYQQLGENHLATIEAIYYVYREFTEAYEIEKDQPYDGRYDNLLFYYRFFYNMIQHIYRHQKKGKKFTSRHRSDYIQYQGDKEKPQ